MFVIAKHVRFPSSESLFQFSWVKWPWESHLTSLSLHFVIIHTHIRLIWSCSTSLHYSLISFPFPLALVFLQAIILLLPCLYSCSSFAGIQDCSMFMIAMAIAYPEACFTAFLHILFLLHIFCPIFQNGSWALGGKISMSHLGLNTQQSFILIASPSNESLDLLSPTEKRSFSSQG